MSVAADVSLLLELRAAGLRLSPLPGGQVHVAPRDRLTSELRARIVARKHAIWAALEAERRIPVELELRIRAMAERWQYMPDDLAYALEDARTNPAGWLSCCQVDEEHHSACARVGIRPVSQGKSA